MVFEGWPLFARWCGLGVEGVMGVLDIEVFIKERLAVLKRWVPRLLAGESSDEKAMEGAVARG